MTHPAIFTSMALQDVENKEANVGKVGHPLHADKNEGQEGPKAGVLRDT